MHHRPRFPTPLNLGYVIEVLEKGCYVAFDTIGIEIVVKDRTKAAMVIGLIGLGYEKRILLSHRSACTRGR